MEAQKPLEIQFEKRLEIAKYPTSVPSSAPGKMLPRTDPQEKPPPERDKQGLARLLRVPWDFSRLQAQRPKVPYVREPQRSIQGCARDWISNHLAEGQMRSTNLCGILIWAPLRYARRPDNTESIVSGRGARHGRGSRQGHSVRVPANILHTCIWGMDGLE